MQTREELYAVLDYHAYERKLDELFARDAEGPRASPARAAPKQTSAPLRRNAATKSKVKAGKDPRKGRKR
jgi:hypothetical protein